MAMFPALRRRVKVQADVVLGKLAWSVGTTFRETIQEQMVSR